MDILDNVNPIHAVVNQQDPCLYIVGRPKALRGTCIGIELKKTEAKQFQLKYHPVAGLLFPSQPVIHVFWPLATFWSSNKNWPAKNMQEGKLRANDTIIDRSEIVIVNLRIYKQVTITFTPHFHMTTSIETIEEPT